LPISITLPAPNGPIGPGVGVAVTTDFIGPIPVDDYVLGYFSPTSDDNLKITPTNWQWFGTSSGGILGLSNITGATVSAYTGPAPLENDVGRFVVEWRHASGAIQESLSIPAKWTTSQLAQYGDLIGWGTAGASGGFTAADRTEAAQTQANTEVKLPVLGGLADLTRSLADWTTLSHGTFLTRGPVILLEGRGSLPVQVLTGRGLPFGAFFSWFRVPAELGFIDGIAPHYARVLLEIGTVYADGGLNLYRQDLKTFTEDGYFWDWLGKVPPTRLDYFVFPGVQVAWQFMYTKP
jgi:hypothetical protein